MARSTVTLNNYSRVVAITTSDTVPISTGPSDAILVGTGGNATCADTAGNTFTLTAVTAGQIIPINVARVNTTGATATLYALYYV